MLAKIGAFLKRNLTTNRITIYLTALVSISGALVTMFADLGTDATVGLVAGVASVNALAIKFLTGWQALEKAMYQQQLMERQHELELEAAKALQPPPPGSLSQAVGKPSVRLPR